MPPIMRTMIHSSDDETIVALCTPRGSGALALIRLSGINSLEIVSQLASLASKESILAVASHTIHFGHVIDSFAKPIDQVMFSVMHAPRTFTGQNVVEITCHNNPFIIELITSTAIHHGARHAGPGEFSARAFLNGKIDLLQAEAINELINAQTHESLKKSLAQLEGTFSHWSAQIEHRLIRTLAWCEASFEFLDEESEFSKEIKVELQEIILDITRAKKIYDIRKQIHQGIRIALIGSVNAGKSSLFNALIGQTRSIVTNIPGTTRDSIEAGIYRKKHFWTLIDTAGIRNTDDYVEKEGVARSREEAHKADVILLVHDISSQLHQEEKELYTSLVADYHTKIIIVKNKSDLAVSLNSGFDADLTLPAISVSGLHSTNIDSLEALIESKIENLFATANTPFLINERHFNLILSLELLLNKIVDILSQKTIPYELVSFHIRESLELISELSGKSIKEAAIDKVFKEFCVGK